MQRNKCLHILNTITPPPSVDPAFAGSGEDPTVSSFTSTDIPTRREGDSKIPTKKDFAKIFYRRKLL